MGDVPDLRNSERTGATRELPFADVGTSPSYRSSSPIELSRTVTHHCGMHHPKGRTRPVATDADLVAAARGGDAAALGLLLERHRPRLFATAIRLLGYQSDAEDAVQETCLAAMRHIGSVRDPEVIEAANEHGLSMIFTGRRHFKH